MKYLVNNKFLISLLIIILNIHLFGGTTGKLSGKITDTSSGEPLIGVNVMVVNTQYGSTTDIEGRFNIIGVPIGIQSVRVYLVGYQEVIIKDVKVSADQTTPLNVNLSSTTVELKTVVITAERLVNPLTTSGVQTIGAQTIEQIPNVKSVQDVVALQAGVVRMGNQMFLRGGRANEVQYVVDGIPVNNIVGNTGEITPTSEVNAALQDIYSGSQTGVIGGGSSGLAVSANAIQTVSVQSSGFDADYGNSQSGIVNIVTKSGGDRFTGSVQYRTDKLALRDENEVYGAFSFGGPEPISRYLLPQLGTKLPGNLTFFISSDLNRSDGPYKYDHNKFYNPIERKIQTKGFLGGILNGLGFGYDESQRNSFTLNSKLKWDIGSSDQISYGYRASLGSGHDYYKEWRMFADSSTLYTQESNQHVLSWVHFFGQNSFARLTFGRVESKEENGVRDIDSMFKYSIITEPEDRDIDRDGFADKGTGQRWFSSKTIVWTIRCDYNSQVHPLHLLKTGAEFNYEEIHSTELANPIYPNTSPNSRDGDPRTWGYGKYRSVMNHYPNRGALYVQDNIEFEGLNLHVGLRYDYMDLGKRIYNPEFINPWLEKFPYKSGYAEHKWANGKYDMNGNLIPDGDFDNKVLGSRFLWYFTHGYFSPRLSIGYPVTDRIVFYFNYGHFLQYPERDHYYRDPRTDQQKSWIGNPDLKPQRTVQYEAGFENQLTDDMAFAIRAFYKDIFDYSTLFRPKGGDYKYDLYINLDFASARGFEVTLSKAFTGNISTNLTYTYQIAKGRSSNPLASFVNPEIQLPRETRLDWDQQHTANIFLRYSVGKKEAGTFGVPFLNNWGLSVKWGYGSGFPYSPYTGELREGSGERKVYLVNNLTKPYTTKVGLSLYKGIDLNPVNLIITLDVENILNRRNVREVNRLTSKPNQYGDYNPESSQIYGWYITENRLDPRMFDSGRQIFLGVKLNWD